MKITLARLVVFILFAMGVFVPIYYTLWTLLWIFAYGDGIWPVWATIGSVLVAAASALLITAFIASRSKDDHNDTK
jgi:membrane protein implicated in regulation of membrane protease activity